ncbi:MAG: hypothetical protein KGI72_05435 [Patescibacteria group bacterium]|nr:hypothetical protein [Patescibacteria group bacterium]
MTDEIKNFGAIESPKDERDFKPEDLGAAIPETYPYSWYGDTTMVPVYMQGLLPNCGGEAGITLYGILANDAEQLSGRFDYDLDKTLDGVPQAQGTTGRAVMKEGQKYGYCLDSLFPDDTSLDYADFSNASLISKAAYKDGLKRRLGAYAQLTDLSFQGIKNAIYDHKAVILLVQVGREWWTNAEGVNSWDAADILPVRPPAQIVSGHFIVAYGYNGLNIFFRNSWSEKWGSNGNGFFGEDYLPFIQEAWVAQLPTPPALPPPPAEPATVQTAQDWIQSILEWLANVLSWQKSK